MMTPEEEAEHGAVRGQGWARELYLEAGGKPDTSDSPKDPVLMACQAALLWRTKALAVPLPIAVYRRMAMAISAVRSSPEVSSHSKGDVLRMLEEQRDVAVLAAVKAMAEAQS